MRRVQRGRGLFTGCPVYETMEERGILDMKRRIIDFHTHLGDIFHDSRNIVFHPQLHFPPIRTRLRIWRGIITAARWLRKTRRNRIS